MEYKSLIHLTGVKKSYLDAIARCLVHLHEPQKLPLAAEQLAKAVTKTSKIFLAMQLALAKQIAAHQHIDHALAMYEYMRKYPELSTGIDKHISALSETCEKTPESDDEETNPPSQTEDTAHPPPSLAGRFNPLKIFGRNKKAE